MANADPSRKGTAQKTSKKSSKPKSSKSGGVGLTLSDVVPVGHRIAEVFGVRPDSLRFMRLQASMVFQGEDDWVYRIPAKPHVRDGFVAERDLMALLSDRMPVAIPLWQVAGDPPIARYRYIPGQPFVPKAFPAGAAGERLLSEIADFLFALHAAPPPPQRARRSLGKGMRRWAERLRGDDRPDIADELEDSLRGFVTAMAARPVVLCHGDFKGANILIDPATGALAGVIDFTGWTVAPPEVDLARVGLPAPLLAGLADRYEARGGISVDRNALAAASRFYACRQKAKRALKPSSAPGLQDRPPRVESPNADA